MKIKNMQNKQNSLLLLLFTLTIVSLTLIQGAFADESFFAEHNFDSVTLNITMTSSFTITKIDSGYVKNLNMYYYLVPSNNALQQVISLSQFPYKNSLVETSQNGSYGQQYLVYNYFNPDQGKSNYGYNSVVKINYKPFKISKIIKYPYEFNNDSLDKYLQPTDKIDSESPSVVALAKKLRDNSTDYFDLVFNTAKWVNSNVNYDLNSVTADVTENASWVLKKHYGVCDEITVLFMALLRANGIPTRFVSGIAFTNSQLFTSSWGFHSWAEVYFPDYGWVPFDVTFGEYGSVDPLRVIFIKSEHAVKPASSYSAQEYHSDIKLANSNPFVSIIDWKLRNDSSDLIYNFSLLYNKINFNSKDILFVNITNPTRYYKIISLKMLAPLNIAYDNKTYLFYLKPHESAKFTTMIKPQGDFKSNYQYLIPIMFSINNHETSVKYLKVSNVFNNYDDSYFRIYKKSLGLKKTANNSTDILQKDMPFSVSCRNNKDIFVGNILNISCSFIPKNENKSAKYIYSSFTVCAEDDCKSIYYTGKKFNLSFSKKVTIPGYQSIKITINALSFSKTITFEGMLKPKIIFSNVIYPKNVIFNKEYSVSFRFRINNSHIINNCTIAGFINNKIFINQSIKDASKEYSFTLPSFNSYILNSGKNKLRITAVCYDKSNNNYNETVARTIVMKNLSWWQQIIKFFYGLFS